MYLFKVFVHGLYHGKSPIKPPFRRVLFGCFPSILEANPRESKYLSEWRYESFRKTRPKYTVKNTPQNTKKIQFWWTFWRIHPSKEKKCWEIFLCEFYQNSHHPGTPHKQLFIVVSIGCFQISPLKLLFHHVHPLKTGCLGYQDVMTSKLEDKYSHGYLALSTLQVTVTNEGV